MQHINYEEIYPTHISHATPTTPCPPNYSPGEPFLHRSDTAPRPVRVASRYQRHATSASMSKPWSAPITPPDNQSLKYPVQSAPRTVLGMSRTVFYLLLALVVVLLAGAVIGVLGVTLLKKNTDKGADGCGGKSPCTTNSTSSLPSNGTSASSDTLGQIASTAYTDSTTSDEYIYVYYQQGSNIMYTVYPGANGFSAPRALNLSTAPKNGTPLAATSFDAGNMGSLDVFYLDKSNNIVQASFTSLKSSTNITFAGTEVIQGGTNVHPSSSLTAIYVDSSFGWRVYYQTITLGIQELVGFSGWTAGSLLGSGIAGTGITVAMIAALNLNVFYIDSTNKTLSFTAFVGAWSAPKSLTNVAITNFEASSSVSLSATAQTKPDTLRLYYTGSDDEIREFYCPTAAAWNCSGVQADQSPAWTSSDTAGPGALAAIGWQDQIRFYYFHNETFVEAGLNSGNWSVGKSWGRLKYWVQF